MLNAPLTSLTTATILALAASTATADPIDFYGTTFSEFANSTYITGAEGWAGGSVLRTNQFWGSDDTYSVYGDRTSVGFAGNYHALATDGAPVTQPFQVSFDMVVRLQNQASFGYAGLALSHTANPGDSNGRWDTGVARLARDPSDGGIKINYFNHLNEQVFIGDDLSTKLYAASNAGYYYTFTLDVDPANRVYDLIVTQTEESTNNTVQLHSVSDLPFRGGTHTSLTSFELGISNAAALSSGTNNRIFVDNIQIVPIPEPGALSLIAVGGSFMLRRR